MLRCSQHITKANRDSKNWRLAKKGKSSDLLGLQCPLSRSRFLFLIEIYDRKSDLKIRPGKVGYLNDLSRGFPRNGGFASKCDGGYLKELHESGILRESRSLGFIRLTALLMRSLVAQREDGGRTVASICLI